MISRTMWLMGTSELRACRLCVHGRDVQAHGGELRACASPDVIRKGQEPMPVNVARAPGGSCGVEAEHLLFPGWSAMRISR